ncbi:hypothetical protein OG920_23610 [Streptomyces europaeiscabiei]|uniref:hypothetical protein n=1 Tax=Streptomyces TaxID=1883 RepID=UPI000A360AD4|nr:MULTISPECIES: hypothetical protein [Streptomyces]MDX3581232.1 hypothetical protein [Streptomyces europaeiscabiei]MDX3615703.1 hypothetical protein [Streptomyces europaeiscabiei]MDX3632611.1 hypothetical protein [Streptomyces europaeiscabiei]MDX3653115.1 hypothetical protein [Streptomyces europaeiscabiei]WUD34161.1 hypothetical protein OG858_24005 [Streptomyces europaeiscabiei]
MGSVRSLFPAGKGTPLAVVVALALSASVVTGATAAGGPPERSPHAKVTGSAGFRLPYFDDADVRSITLDAHAVPYSRPVPGVPSGLPTDARGTVTVSHYSAERDTTYTARGTVDCLVTAPDSATLTAVITEVSAGGPDWEGKRVGLSVRDGGVDRSGEVLEDRVGFSWADGVNTTFGEDGPTESPVGPCMAPAPFAPVTAGGYRVRHADLPPWPTG